MRRDCFDCLKILVIAEQQQVIRIDSNIIDFKLAVRNTC